MRRFCIEAADFALQAIVGDEARSPEGAFLQLSMRSIWTEAGSPICSVRVFQTSDSVIHCLHNDPLRHERLRNGRLRKLRAHKGPFSHRRRYCRTHEIDQRPFAEHGPISSVRRKGVLERSPGFNRVMRCPNHIDKGAQSGRDLPVPWIIEE
jgi:hypothetical protein